jgi:hypothetical protein
MPRPSGGGESVCSQQFTLAFNSTASPDGDGKAEVFTRTTLVP